MGDLERAEAFYAGTLGLPVVDARGRAAYVTDPDGHVVEFWAWNVAGHLDRAEENASPANS